MRALILRRVGLIETGAGPIIIGDDANADVLRLTNFLRRNGHPYQQLDPGDRQLRADARPAVRSRLGTASDRPLSVGQDPPQPERGPARPLRRARRAGRRRTSSTTSSSLARGPAGLATSVYAASEGLSVLAVDCRSFGGQAGASARIENYLGFPTGISGMALMGRAFSQAQKFGVEILIPDEAVKLECGNDPCHVQLRTGERIQARVRRDRNRRALPPPRGRAARRVRRLVGPLLGIAAGSRPCAGQDVALVGGGNSAGQATVFLAAMRAASL